MVAVSTFFIDDSGTRHPNHIIDVPYHGNDWFALGGILINDEQIDASNKRITTFKEKWPQIGSAPLHSYEIRGKHENFAWLGQNSNLRNQFLAELEQLLFQLPVLGFACVIDRPGYNVRYREKYGRQQWRLCKTAFEVVVERAVKYSAEKGRKLRVYVERSSKTDDAVMRSYYDTLKTQGHSFNSDTSAIYNPLGSTDFASTLYEFRTKEKSSKLMQIADLYLWPMCIGGYDEGNRAYSALIDAGKLIDCALTLPQITEKGIKYSCFDLIKRKPKNAKAE